MSDQREASARRTEASLGRAVALVALWPLAERLAARVEREEREERERLEAERRAERKARRAEARGRLARSARREVVFVAVWAAAWLLLTIGISIPITFKPPGAGIEPAALAALHYQWRAALVGAVVMLLAGWAYDLVQARSGRMAWSAGDPSSYLDLTVLALGLPGVFMLAANQDHAVPPSAWTAVPLVLMAAFVLTLCLRLLGNWVKEPSRRKAALLLAALGALGLAWLLAPRSDVPSSAEQAKVDRRLIAGVPMPHCASRPIAALPPGLFRNSLDGLVRCHQGGIRGTFIAFSSEQLLEIYVSQREFAVEHRTGSPADSCRQRSGTYVYPWHRESHPKVERGQSFCYGSGRRATIAWSDTRRNLFAAITGRPRARLYHWWHTHSVRF